MATGEQIKEAGELSTEANIYLNDALDIVIKEEKDKRLLKALGDINKSLQNIAAQLHSNNEKHG